MTTTTEVLEPSPVRPSEAAARAAIEAWLNEQAPGYPDYSICEDGDDGWSFWIATQDTTSYLHHDMRIEWYGTGWPEWYAYNPDDGIWSDACAAAIRAGGGV
jgi:hypothetical protein